MKKIPLTRGKVALVDDKFFEALSQWKWTCDSKDRTDYAYRQQVIGGKLRCIKMHRFIAGRLLGWKIDGLEIDHRNTNGLDNRGRNLRVATSSQQKMNSRVRAGRKYKGVSYHRPSGLFLARIYLPAQTSLGYYETDVEAAKAYNKAAQLHFGEFARLNVI